MCNTGVMTDNNCKEKAASSCFHQVDDDYILILYMYVLVLLLAISILVVLVTGGATVYTVDNLYCIYSVRYNLLQIPHYHTVQYWCMVISPG